MEGLGWNPDFRVFPGFWQVFGGFSRVIGRWVLEAYSFVLLKLLGSSSNFFNSEACRPHGRTEGVEARMWKTIEPALASDIG